MEREIEISKPDSSYFLDYWVVDGSLNVFHADTLIPQHDWDFEPETGLWRLINQDPWLGNRVLTFRFSVIPISLRRRFFERELTEPPDHITENGTDESAQIAARTITSRDLFGESRLERSGSLRRGIVVGSNQDFSLESGLRFDLSGYITDDVEVLATLTDRSTPIQPDGSTQNLREFDQVYIRLQSPIGTLQLGDVDVRLDNSEFAVIERRLQGADIQTDFQDYGAYGGSAAVVRGQFRVQQFQGQDGIQGPYRLAGSEGETFIIVLAGTERVYLNGERMNRGEENDYIIDYGLGEIHFMNNRIITDASRITVDFQYLSDQYTRTLTTAEAQHDELLGGRLSFGASVIREADNVNLGTQFQLSDEDLEILRNAGDDPEAAMTSGADSVGYRRDADFILYSQVDTVYQGETYSIFKSMPGDSSGVYRVRFSRVDEGTGSYIRAGREVNGIVYEWVGPDMGNYEPARRLPLPSEQIMVSLRSRYSLTRHMDVFGEWAGSRLDENRLSPLSGNRLDNAYTIGARINPVRTRIGTLNASIRQRYTDRNFSFFDRTREVEFDRRWNILDDDQSQERITEGKAGWQIGEFTTVTVSGGHINRDEMEGNRQDIRLSSQEQGLPQFDYFAERIDSRNQILDEEGNWFRQQGAVSQGFDFLNGWITPRFGFENEHRRQKVIEADSLTPASFRFYEFSPGIEYRMDETFTVSADLSWRQDEKVVDDAFTDEAVGVTQQYAFTYRPGSIFQTSNSVAFRSRVFEDFFRISEQRMDSRGVLIRSSTDFRPFDRFIDAHVYYEANTERRPVMQETFIEVGPEFGNYIWDDLNGDGVRQIDEFFPELNPNEGIYMRRLIPSDELFPIVALQTRFRLRLNPEHLYSDRRNLTRLEEFIAGTRFDTRIDISEHNKTEQIEDIYLLRFNSFRDDSLTLQGRLALHQDIRLFGNHPDYNVRLTADRSSGQNQQATGVEKQFYENFRAEGSYRFLRTYTLRGELRLGRRHNISDNLPSRNYEISSRELRPGMDIRMSRDLQAGMGVAVIRRKDTFPADPVKANAFNIHTDARISAGPNLQGFFRVERRSFHLDGEPGSLGLFEITDGAGEGNTWNWSVQANYRISDFIRAGLSYDGRTVTDRPLIHTMRFEVSAAF